MSPFAPLKPRFPLFPLCQLNVVTDYISSLCNLIKKNFFFWLIKVQQFSVLLKVYTVNSGASLDNNFDIKRNSSLELCFP